MITTIRDHTATNTSKEGSGIDVFEDYLWWNLMLSKLFLAAVRTPPEVNSAKVSGEWDWGDAPGGGGEFEGIIHV